MVRTALYLQDDFPLRESIKLAQYAEMRGFEAVWQAETRLSRDAVVPMAAYAATTNRIKIGAGVINNWSRNTAVIASTFLTLDDLAPDRIICGLGAWYDPLAQQVGINRSKPLLAMRETVETVRALLAGERVNFRGEFVQIDSQARLVPIYLGLGSPKMGALAGEIADGVLLNYLVSPTFNQDVMDELERGVKKAGRSLDAIDRPQLIACSVDHNRVKALDTARRIVTLYIAQQPRMVKACGVRQELIEEIAQVLTWDSTPEQISDAMRLIPDDVVQLITASGTPDEVRAKVQEYISCGATCAVLYPLGNDPRYMIDVFADRYVE
jgi:5,10-methylenetetrahydromethanopterin reductase